MKKDPEKDSYVIISSFNWREVFKPSFIGRLQSRLAAIFKDRDKKKYDKMKFKLLLVPADVELYTKDEHLFEQIMYAMYGPEWPKYFEWKKNALKQIAENQKAAANNENDDKRLTIRSASGELFVCKDIWDYHAKITGAVPLEEGEK